MVAIVPMTRNGARWVWRALQMRTGFSYGRYAKKFIREFGSYENPYLGEYEKIDLRSTYFFAHRSIQEFLAAEELQHQRDGDAFLLAQATDMNWRQAIQFYTAGREAGLVDDFITELATRDSELAAYCLRGASPSDGAARAVLDALKPVTNARLNALAAASRSPRVPVQRMAIEELKRFIADSRGTASTAGTSIDGMLPLLESLAGTNAGEIAALVPQVIRDLPDDPRLVAPLWQCLSADGTELHPSEAAEIVRRLLAMAMERDGFAELERQDPHDREFLAAARSQAYPFKDALPPDHNLVTLLAWADYLKVMPAKPNRFFAAKAANRLRTVEADRRRTISLSRLARRSCSGEPGSSCLIATDIITCGGRTSS